MPKIDLEQAYIDLKQRYDKLEENMSSTQANLRKEINTKQDRITELEKEISGLKVEISKADALNEKIAQLQIEIERIEGEKARLIKEKDDLVATFKAEQDRNTDQMQKIHAHIDRVEEQLEGLGEKDKIAREKDEKDKIAREKAEKDLAQKDSFYAEKETLLKAKITAETKAQNLEKEIQDLRRKMRETGDGLLGSSMEIETLKEKLKKSEQEIQKINERVLSLTTGNTGIIMEMADLVKIMKEKFLQGKRNVRVVMPNIKDFDRHGFIPLLEKLSPQAMVYVAAAMDPAANEELINSLRDKKVQLVNFQEGNMYGLNVDGALCLLTLVGNDAPDKILAGFYTDIEAAVPIFKDAIQKAWVKGTKM